MMAKVLFDRSVIELKKLIAGRETLQERLIPDPKVTGHSTVATVSFYIAGARREFNVHADAHCSAIAKFVTQATPQNICIAAGPRGGQLLGIDQSYVEQFYVYVRP